MHHRTRNASARSARKSAGCGRSKFTRALLQATSQLARFVLVSRHGLRAHPVSPNWSHARTLLRRVRIELAVTAACAPTARGVLARSIPTAGRLLRGRPAVAKRERTLDRRSLGVARSDVRMAARRLGKRARRSAFRALENSIFERRHAHVRRPGLVRRSIAADPESKKARFRIYTAQRADPRVAARVLRTSMGAASRAPIDEQTHLVDMSVPAEFGRPPAITISTRRLLARPSAVSLLATGLALPLPTELILSEGMPLLTR